MEDRLQTLQTNTPPWAPEKPTTHILKIHSTESSNMPFRQALMEAARQAFHNNEISRFDLLKIRLASVNQRWCNQMADQMMGQLISEGLVPVSTTDYNSINWETFISKLIEYLPIILQILSLFLG